MVIVNRSQREQRSKNTKARVLAPGFSVFRATNHVADCPLGEHQDRWRGDPEGPGTTATYPRSPGRDHRSPNILPCMIAAMQTRERLTEVVEAEGHLIDSQLLNLIFDTVIKGDASFEVLRFTIGRTNEEPSFISIRITAPDEGTLQGVLENLVGLGCRMAGSRDAELVRADKDGCVPNDFYSTTNLRTF